MKIVFMGTPDFACSSLERLYSSSHKISAVVTVPDKPRGRGQKVLPSAVKKKAKELEIPLLQPQNLSDKNFIEDLTQIKANLFVIVAFRILPEEVFTIPEEGSINLHASLLPAYRGAAPINRVIMNGETKSGVTTFFLKKKVDTGNLILQKKVPISENMTAGELHDNLMTTGAELLLDTVNLIESGNFSVSEQDNSLASPAPKLFQDDCAINWQKDAAYIHNQIRGLDPYPGAYTHLDGNRYKLYSSQISDSKGMKPGEIKIHRDVIEVGCASGSIQIRELQLTGKRRMTVDEFLRGNLMENGAVFKTTYLK